MAITGRPGGGQWRRPRLVLAVIGITLGSIGSTRADPGLSIRTGVGYEYMSQEFFLDQQGQLGGDSLELVTNLKTTYLDDFKGQLNLSYVPYEDYRLEIRGAAEQTPDQLRLRLSTGYHRRLGSAKLDWSGEVERRDDQEAEPGSDYGYFSGFGRLKITQPISKPVSLWASVRSDFIDFDSEPSGLYNYYRLGGQFGMIHAFNGFSSLSVNLFATGRTVSQAVDQSYVSSGLEGSVFGFYAQGQIDALLRFENRDYDQELDLGDYSRFELSVANRHSIGGRYFAREELEWETLTYDTTEVLPERYSRGELTLLLGMDRDSWSLAVGLQTAGLREQTTVDYTVGEEYNEAGLKAQLDITMPGKVFLSLESVTGRRDMSNEGIDDIVLSDFNYQRANLLADFSLTGRLGLNAMAAADWEWHEREEENSRMFLISTSLNVSF